MDADLHIMITACGLAYLIGSVPFGLLLTRWAGLGDIRAIGSGNIGTTNAFRAGGKKLGIATLLLDMGKGVLAVMLVHLIWNDTATAHMAMLAVILGHCFPLWLRFKGGKGVATTAGAVLSFYHLALPVPAMVVMLPLFSIWLGVFLVSRTVSLASLMVAVCLPAITLLMCGFYAHETVIALLVIIKHRENIIRLCRGTEHRFNFSKKADNG